LLSGSAIILLSLLAGNFLSAHFSLPIPGNIIGMTLLLFALIFGVVKVRTIKPVCDFLLQNMALFFVPVGVGMVAHFDLIGREFLPITVSMIASTFLVMGATGLIAQRMLKGKGSEDELADR